MTNGDVSTSRMASRQLIAKVAMTKVATIKSEMMPTLCPVATGSFLIALRR